MTKIKYLIPFYIAILLYLTSLMTVYFYNGSEEHLGIVMLLLGWLTGINDIFTFIAWFANITFIMAILSVAKRKKAPKVMRGLILSGITLVFGLCGFLMGTIDSESASTTMANGSFGLGFYIWVLSFVAMFISMYLRFKSKKAS